MLVWLSSYPRSGNTLLRQVFKRCFDLSSCEGLDPPPPGVKPDELRDRYIGCYFVEGDPDAFYRRARSSADPVLLMSHRPPRDDEKAIYVVRDGRLALESFVAFQDAYHPGSSSFESLLVGDHVYGDWTGHYRSWCERRSGPTLIVRFEQLVSADATLLARLAEFVGLPGPVRPWINPLSELRAREPLTFGAGETVWRPSPYWSEFRLRAFYTLHGPLLAQLGYATAAEVEAGAYPAESPEGRLLRAVRGVAGRGALQAVCDERAVALARAAAACEAQAGEIATLAEACAAREELLREMSAVCADRERQLAEMVLRAERRADLRAENADRQLATAVARIDELQRHCLRLERRMWWRRLPLFGLVRRLARAGGG
jgi:hypothetical protein